MWNIERFWSRVIGTEFTQCWQWAGSKDRHGYGRIWVSGHETGAHRFAYEALIVAVPDGLDLDHLCRNRSCVNPWHMEPVTRRENVMRGNSIQSRNARKTHCPRGHPYDEENTKITGRPGRNLGRECRICIRSRRKIARGRMLAMAILTPDDPRLPDPDRDAREAEQAAEITALWGGGR
jgi:hypothetical protein